MCGVWVGCLAVCVSSVLVPSLFRSARQLSYEFRPTVAADQCPQIPASPSSEVPALFTFDGACSTFAGGVGGVPAAPVAALQEVDFGPTSSAEIQHSRLAAYAS